MRVPSGEEGTDQTKKGRRAGREGRVLLEGVRAIERKEGAMIPTGERGAGMDLTRVQEGTRAVGEIITIGGTAVSLVKVPIDQEHVMSLILSVLVSLLP